MRRSKFGFLDEVEGSMGLSFSASTRDSIGFKVNQHSTCGMTAVE